MDNKTNLDKWHRRIGAYIAKVEKTLNKPYLDKKERDEIIDLGQNIVHEALFNNF